MHTAKGWEWDNMMNDIDYSTFYKYTQVTALFTVTVQNLHMQVQILLNYSTNLMWFVFD